MTDANTAAGASLIPGDAGYFRTWNANATAFKLMQGNGRSYWVEFDAQRFQVGSGGSALPVLHPLGLSSSWEWSAVDPHTIYFLNGTQLAQYSKATETQTNMGGPPNGDSVTYHVAVVGADSWVCSPAGAGRQDTYTKVFCVNPANPSQSKFIDIVNRLINGVYQYDPNWPTSAPGQTIGIHSLFGSAGGTWLAVSFHGHSWGANGMAVLNLTANTWSLARPDGYWGGHPSLGHGKYLNGGGSIDGKDSRGALIRDPDHLMDTSSQEFIMQPPDTLGWYDSEHSSWFNASTNPSAPVLFSRYNGNARPPTPLAWYGEIVLAATDGSNTVWRFAHNHNGGGNFYGQAFGQISNDGRWALFSSYWDGTLGSSNGDLGIASRVDTFIVELLR